MAPPAPQDPKRDRTSLIRRAGTAVFAFGIFISGWMGMQTEDWRQMVLWVVIAAGCGWFASRLAAWGR
jgi:hypothetical protein